MGCGRCNPRPRFNSIDSGMAIRNLASRQNSDGDATARCGGEPPAQQMLQHGVGEPLFEVLAHNVPGVVYLCNNDSRYTMQFLSEAVEDLLGISAEEFLADRVSFVDLYHPEDATGIPPQVDAALAARRPFHLEYRLRHRDGHWVWVEERGQGVFDAQGQLAFLEGAIFDIGERKQAEAVARQSEEQYRAIFEAATDALMLFTVQGQIVEANPAACEMLGYTRKEFLQLAPHQFIHADDLHLFDQFVETINSGEHFHCFARDIRKDGMLVDIEVHGSGILYHGQPHLLAIVRDITERKRAADELQRAHDELEQRVQSRTAELVASEQRFRQLAENIQEVFWITTPNKDEMIYVSPAYETIFGRSCQSLYDSPKSFLEVIHPDDRQRVRDELSRQAQGDYSVEYRLLRDDGTIRWIFSRAFPVRNPQGEVYRIAGLAEDITSRKEAEGRLRSEERVLRNLLNLQERERKLLAYEIHDGFVQDVVGSQMIVEAVRYRLLRDGSPDGEKLVEAGESLQRAINEGRRMISELRPLVIDERGIVEAIQFVVQESRRQGLEIQFRSDPDFPRPTPLLEGTLFRIVQEAVNNIHRHSHASRATIRLRQRDGWIRVEIADTGVGFDPAKVPHTRFGLDGIRKRAQLFGGAAEIHSAPGKGTRVVVDLPALLEVAAGEEAGSDSSELFGDGAGV